MGIFLKEFCLLFVGVNILPLVGEEISIFVGEMLFQGYGRFWYRCGSLVDIFEGVKVPKGIICAVLSYSCQVFFAKEIRVISSGLAEVTYCKNIFSPQGTPPTPQPNDLATYSNVGTRTSACLSALAYELHNYVCR